MKKAVAAVLAGILSFSLCACGSMKSENSAYSYAPAAYTEEAWEYDMSDFAATEAASLAGSAAGYKNASPADGLNGTAEEGEPNAQNAINPDKIIYSGSASIETTDFDASIAKLEEMVSACGGFIESSGFNDSSYWSKSHGYSGGRSASYQLRIPSASFGDMMNGLSALGNVPSSSSSSTNVTSQYYDVSARLEAYLAQETRLIELYEAAETMDDIIAIEDRLSEVRYHIESCQSTLNNYDRRVAYSDIYLSISEVAEYTPTVPVKQTFGEKFVKAVGSGFESAVLFIQGFILVAAESLPTLVVVAAAAALIIVIVRKATAKGRAERKARREARKAEKAEKE